MRYHYIFVGITLFVAPIVLFIGGQVAIIMLITNLVDKDGIENVYDFMNNTSTKALVVYPSYTYYAYEKNSFADIGTDECFECHERLVNNVLLALPGHGGVSDVGGSVYFILNDYYDTSSDYKISLEPEILNEYDKVILMRNEYVSAEFYRAIENHEHVIYMFPDAMTKQVHYNNSTSMLSYLGELEPLHEKSFEFADDNRCEDWEFIEVENGYMMNCTPDIAILFNKELLLTIRDI